jgi:hypothetical protein
VVAFNSCRSRSCPKCQDSAARKWLAERETELLDTGYFHLVFTLPAAVADIAWQNKEVVYGMLFKAAAEAVLTIAADPRHLGVRVGTTAVLHTWGSAMTHHPHMHDRARRRVLRRRHSVGSHPGRASLPVRVLSRLFRRLFLRLLAAAHAERWLAFFGALERLAVPRAFAAFVKRQRRPEWVVYAKAPFAGPKAVVAYLARYTHRIAISNRKLIRASLPERAGLPGERNGQDGHCQIHGLSHRRALCW